MKQPIDSSGSPGSIVAIDQKENPLSTTPTPPALYLDYARYERYLTDSDLDEAQKKAFLDALWQIIVSFVDLGFGVHPLQQACGEQAEAENIVKTWQSACVKSDRTSHRIIPHNNASTIALASERSPE